MAKYQIEATFENKEVVKFIKEVETRLKYIKGVQKRYVGLLSAIVFRDVQEHFQDEEGPEGKWPDWSDSYFQYLKDIGRGGNQMLAFSGNLRQNFRPTKFRNSSEGPLWFNNAQTKDGFPYAFAHNEGGGKLPKREFMWLSDRALYDISEQTLQFMLEEGV